MPLVAMHARKTVCLSKITSTQLEIYCKVFNMYDSLVACMITCTSVLIPAHHCNFVMCLHSALEVLRTNP